MRLLLLILLASPSYAALDTFWVNDGSYKMARQDTYPLGFSSNTLSTNWDGDTATTFGGRNETVSLVLYMASDGSDSTNVSVSLSALTGPSASIASVEVSSGNVFDFSNRPVELFYVRYLEIQGMSQLMNDPTEYDAFHYPKGFRRPCTMSGDRCLPDGGTGWTDRPDHNKFYPEILVPYEAVRHSSFTVSASSSQAIWIDIYIGKDKPAGTYTGTLTVREGVSVSTQIPVSLTVYDFELPDQANWHILGFMSGYDINYRHNGTHTWDETDAHLSIRNRYRQMLKRHKFSGSIGEDVTSGANEPRGEHRARLNGSLFSNASGYYNAPGVDTPDPYYSIGTYGSWQAVWSGATTNASTFCGRIDGWADWFSNNSPDTISFLYITDEPSDLTDTNTYSTWMSTSCAHASGYRVKSMVTASHVGVNSGAPNIQYPMSTTYVSASSSTVDTAVSSYTANQGRSWYYNSYSPWTGWSMTEAEGYDLRELPWGAYKKNVMGWFYWDTTHFTDDNNTGCRSDVDNDLWGDARTFGCDGTFNSVKGVTASLYSNGDGVLMYPGRDTVGSVNYTLDGPMASWRLKMWRRGIQDVDYLVLADAVDSEATQAVMDVIVGGRVMWEYDCEDLGDCTYAFGPKGFSEDANDYEAQRLVLAELLDGTEPAATVKTQFSGTVTFMGGVTWE